MKIKLTEAQTIKGKDYEPGDEPIVKKEAGERMIAEGVANRLIEAPENRMRAIRFSGHQRIYSDGSNGRKYVKKGDDFVEVGG